MPYRRLPNTDLARIRSLKKATEMEGYKENGELVLSYQTIRDATQLLSTFSKAQQQYAQCYALQSKSSKTYRVELSTARMYISHFIQVLNMTVQRGELRAEIKTDYGLDPDNPNCPDLTPEAAVYAWGEKVIHAEEERIARGGVPIYNPTIAKVKVHYSIFADHYFSQNMLRANVAKALEEVTEMRPAIDDLILDIWNQVEQVYGDYPPDAKIERCKRFGLIYYMRKSELDKARALQMQQDFGFTFHD